MSPIVIRWVICLHTMLLQSDLAGEQSQSAAEDETASERTFVRFFSTKHGSLGITVGRWLPEETPIRSAGWEAPTSSRSQGEVHHDGGVFLGTSPCVPEGKDRTWTMLLRHALHIYGFAYRLLPNVFPYLRCGEKHILLMTSTY